jgi:excinuclease UvrABC ATPase subunit
MPESIRIRGARVHNLKNVSFDIPRDTLVAFVGVSGSGKSSLVFDTIHTEAQRQLIETFSSFARRRLPKLSRPDVDDIENLSTSIVIDQKRLGRTLRSTVGTATEVATYLRMLFARCGDLDGVPSFIFSFNHPTGMCPTCSGLGTLIRVDPDQLLDPTKTLRDGALMHPDWKVGGWNWRELMAIDLFDLDRPVSTFTSQERELLLYSDDVPITRSHGGGTYAKTWRGAAKRLERYFTDQAEDGAAPGKRDAYHRYLHYVECDACSGSRLNEQARSVRLAGRGIHEASTLELTELDAWLATITGPIADPLVHKMRRILGHLIDIGVGYLSLGRSVASLSGGESQRVKMARQLDCDLVCMLYILDEPSIGLHPRDVGKLVDLLRQLQQKGNSVLVVEHEPTVIASADHVVEIGPVAGRDGGHVVFAGPALDFASADTVTARTLRGGGVAPRPRRPWTEVDAIRDAHAHNLVGLDVDIPKRVLVALTGVAGSGKSTLMQEVFLPAHPDAVVVDQTAIGRSSRSVPATYLGLFDVLRKRFAKHTGRPASLFSFNSASACPDCRGAGSIAVEMSFLDDVRTTCTTCDGRRYTDEVLALRWNGVNIWDVLCLTAAEALERFAGDRDLRPTLQLLVDVGLGYLTLGQPLSTLSGGEAQRLKLATELGKHGNLYVLDEPTTGLHATDTDKLMVLLDRLVDDGNSVIIIEHDMSVVACCDWVIDLGPEGGQQGGRLVATGTPEDVGRAGVGHTARYLAEVMGLESRRSPGSPTP